MFSRFFIDRPIFAAVLSIVITLAGAVAMTRLPVTQYPEITPPTVEISASFPGANAQVVSDTVASPIEQQVNGVEDMLYMSSQCTNDGEYVLNVTFKPGTDLNQAQVLVQNRVSQTLQILPPLVQRRGVNVKKKSPTVLMIVNLFSPQGSRDNLYLSNYATIQLRDELSRLPGVGDISFLGQRDYSMRIWLDPERLAARNLSAGDVIRAIEQQNVQVAAGQIGQPPAPTDQVFQYTMSTLGRLSDASQFGDMVLKTDAQGRTVRMSDISETQLGAQTYDQLCTLDQQPSVALQIYQLPGSNALQTAEAVKARMAELKERFPIDMDYRIVYDTTPFIQESIHEVNTALRDAVILVAIVVLIFLQGWRAAVIPLVAVPVAIIGTFAAMAAADYSLNTLTLFGLVLAIGIVVDDAIVVVEAIEHHLEHGMEPREAAITAMDQVSGPVIAVALVLTAVFVPCLFIEGILGQFFRQFAVTISISTLISAFNSLTLSPALSVLLLQRKSEEQTEPLPKILVLLVFAWLGYWLGSPQGWLGLPRFAPQAPAALVTTWMWAFAALGLAVGWGGSRVVNRGLGDFFRLFNRGFHWLSDQYVFSIGKLLRWSAVVLIGYVGLLYATIEVFEHTPTGFIPAQDKGYLLIDVRLPDGASLQRTAEAVKQIEELVGKTSGVRHTLAIAGQSILNSAKAPNFGTLYAMLDEFHDRGRAGSSHQIAAALAETLNAEIASAEINILQAPPIEGLGTAGGFKIVLEDRGDLGLRDLQEVSTAVVNDALASPRLSGAFTSFRGNTPWYRIDIDRVLAKSKAISLAEVFNTLQVYFGSLYVNDFNRFGRTWQVNIQADDNFRMRVEDLKRIHVRNDHGEMVPFSSIAQVVEETGPLLLTRYNLYPSAMVTANPGANTSSGQAIETLQALSNQDILPAMRAEWTELAFLQLGVGSTAMSAFALSVVLVFLVLAAQYESWSLPLAVILVVPLCLLCAIIGVLIAGMDINVFTQIGFIVLVGLACKNAILIVEFARAQREAGSSVRDATLEACKLRLRPIIMTSLAFILGVVPLMIGTGAGAEMRRTLGVAVFAGMLGVTLFGVFLTPVFYFVIQATLDWWKPPKPAIEPSEDHSHLESTSG
jgi:multidrug efflux pump